MSDTATCDKCGAAVVRDRWFWILPSEVGSAKATFCPQGGTHEVDDEDGD